MGKCKAMRLQNNYCLLRSGSCGIVNGMALDSALFGILGFIPGIIWLFFFLQEDARRPEPKRLIISTFLLGGLATFMVLPLQILAKHVLLAGGVPDANPFHLFLLAALEELLKFAVVFFWVLRHKEFDEPIDAMVYMVVAALGFATVENIATAIRAVNSIELLTLRFIGATLLHSLSSGVVGYYWARGIIACKQARYLVVGLVLASVFHTIFNYLMVVWGPGVKVTGLLVMLGFLVLYDFETLKKPSVAKNGKKCDRPF